MLVLVLSLSAQILKTVIPAHWSYVVDTRMCTVLGSENGSRISTVEHLMASLAGCGIDNAVIKLDGPEVPIMDGSSLAFVAMIESAGVLEQNAPRRMLRVLKSVMASDGKASVSLSPADRPKYDVKIEYDDTVVASQSISFEVINGAFCKELAEARTFGFLDEVEALRAHGLARGGSLENAIVVDTKNDCILNVGGLRKKDEFVRHKVLDAIGDLYLAGGIVVGKFYGYCSGHSLNYKLLQTLFADNSAWCWDIASDKEVDIAVDGGISAINASAFNNL